MWPFAASKHVVKVTRRIGEDEILEMSFSDPSTPVCLERTGQILDFLIQRMEDRNRKVLEAAEELGKAQAGKRGPGSVERIK